MMGHKENAMQGTKGHKNQEKIRRRKYRHQGWNHHVNKGARYRSRRARRLDVAKTEARLEAVGIE